LDHVPLLFRDLGTQALLQLVQRLANIPQQLQVYRCKFSPRKSLAGGQRLQPIRVIVASDTSIDAVAALSDAGKYVAVDVRNVDTEMAEIAENNNDADASGVRLYQSVYETAMRNQIPRPIIDELVRIYSYDVDFQRKVQPGDSFEVLYAGEEETPVADNRSVISRRRSPKSTRACST